MSHYILRRCRRDIPPKISVPRYTVPGTAYVHVYWWGAGVLHTLTVRGVHVLVHTGRYYGRQRLITVPGGYTGNTIIGSIASGTNSNVYAVPAPHILRDLGLPSTEARSQQPFAGGKLGDSRPRSSEPIGSTPAIWAGSQGVSGRQPSYGGHRARGGRHGQELHRDGAHVVVIDRRRLSRGSSARLAAYDFLV